MADSSVLLVDSSVWVDVLRGRPGSREHEPLKTWIHDDRIATNPVIRLELLGGSASQPEYSEIEVLLEPFHELPINDAIWVRAARLGFSLRRSGVTVPHTDLIISACAIEHSCTVIHRDRHYTLIAKHCSLLEQRL